MYELLSPEENTEFRNSIDPVIKRDTHVELKKQEEVPIKIYVGKVNRLLNESSLIMTGVFSSATKTFIVKFLRSQNIERIADEQGAFLVFCEMTLEKFIQLAKEKSKESILVHTDEMLMLEVLLNNNFEITKSKNGFYRAFKVLQNETNKDKN